MLNVADWFQLDEFPEIPATADAVEAHLLLMGLLPGV